MAGVDTINLNGTDYEVQDAPARQAQDALDAKCDNIGTVIEEQVQPLVQKAEDIAAVISDHGVRIAALQNVAASTSWHLVYEDEADKGAFKVSGLGASAKTVAFAVEFKISANNGFASNLYLPVATLSFSNNVPAAETRIGLGKDSGTAVNIFRRGITFSVPSGSYASWSIEFADGSYGSYNASALTAASDVMVPLRIWRVDQEV